MIQQFYDAMSFLVMRYNNITEALTADRLFIQEGFVKLLQAPQDNKQPVCA